MMNVKVMAMLAVCCALTVTAYAQDKTENQTAIVPLGNDNPNKKDAVYPGGMSEFYYYIVSKVKIDSTCAPGKKVNITFMIDKKGKLRKARVGENVLSDGMNRQLVKIFESAPDWTPAKQNGHELKEYFVCPIMFMPKTDLIASNKK